MDAVISTYDSFSHSVYSILWFNSLSPFVLFVYFVVRNLLPSQVAPSIEPCHIPV